MRPTNAASNRSAKRRFSSTRSIISTAIIFLIFDVEAIFLVPFAVAFTGLPVGAFIAILVFLLLLHRRACLGVGQGMFAMAALAR